MKAIVTPSQRAELEAKLSFTNPSQSADLRNPNMTQPELILALLHEVHKGHRILITSLRSDHGDDSLLGLHGHAHGYSADVWVQDDGLLLPFTQGLCTSNPWVCRVGLGGAAQGLELDFGSTIVFNDNATDHIHLQTGG